MTAIPSGRPAFDRLYAVAAAQQGLFSTQQAAAAGYSPQMLAHLIRTRRLVRLHRGIYRLVHYPAGDEEHLVAVWLWSEQLGVFSHITALALHGLSEALPSRVVLSLPVSWRRRRLRVPSNVDLQWADVAMDERTWWGAVPITQVARTLNDCAQDNLSPDLLRTAAQQALARGLVEQHELVEVMRALGPFGGLA